MDVEGWEVVTLEDVCAKAINGGTPSTEVEKYWEGDIPWITGADILNQKVSKIRRYITDEAVRNSSTNVIPKGNLLVVTRTRVGKLAIAPFDVAVSQDFTGIIPNEKIKTEFLFWLLNNSANYFLDLTQGTSINGITRKDLMGFVSPIPPLPEQHQIAEILSTVDRAIEQTEAIITKQQRIKTGLMQDLLTRGIDEHGNIRSEETHEFKDSPLGRIPVEWTDKTLFEVYAEIPKNGIFKTAKEIGIGSLMIGQTSFTSNRRINYMNSRRTNVSISELMSYKLQENDILITRVYATVDGVGMPVLVEEIPEPAVYESNMLRLRVDTNQILPRYTFYWLMSAHIRTFVVASVNASNQTSINQQVMNSIPITIPQKTEQETIVSVLAKSEKSIEDSTLNLRKLRSLKTALMQDLLNGKKRVTALLNDTEKITS